MLRAGDGQDPRWSYDAIDGWEEPRTQFGFFVVMMLFSYIAMLLLFTAMLFQYDLYYFGQMYRCSSFFAVSAFECSFLDLCGSGTPRCGGSFLRIGQLFAFQHFLSFLGDHLSAWCDILKSIARPQETMSYDTVKYRTPIGNSVVRYYKVSHALLRNVVRHWKSVACLKEKCRPSLVRSVALLQ